MFTWSRFDSFPYRGPRPRQEHAVREQLPLVRREHAEELELVRRQVDRLAGPRDRALLEVDDELADLDHRLRRRARRGAAPRGAARAARRSRPASSRSRRRRRRARRSSRAPRRPPRARSPAPWLHLRSSRQTSIPVPSGSTRSRITASGGRIAAAASAPSAVVGGLDLVAGAAEARAQRPQDLLLVVDDEDRGRRSRGDLDAAQLPASGEHERRALPGPRLDRRAGRRSPRRSRARSRARGRRRASRRSARRGGTARRSARARPAGHPGRGRSRARAPPTWLRATWTRTGSPGGEYLSAFSIRFTSARWIWCASTETAGDVVRAATPRPARRRRPSSSSAADDELVELDQPLLGLGRARLEPREVEQVPDQMVEPVGGGEDRREQLARGPRRRSRGRAARARRPRWRSPSAASAGRG